MAVALVAVVGAAIAAGVLGMQGGNADDTLDPDEESTYVVKKGPLTISVSEGGAIKSREQEVIRNELEGRAVILKLIEEGSHARKGDLLVELDGSALHDQQVDQQIRMQNSYAEFIRSRENLEVVKNQTQSDVAKAELDHRFAQINLDKYNEGEFPAQLQDAESKVKLAKATEQQTKDTLEWSKKLAGENYISATELAKDDLTWQRSSLDVKLAQTNLDLLNRFTKVQKVEELKSNVDQSKFALERAKRKATADVVQAEADLSAKQSEYDRQKAKLEKIGRQITKTKIFAPSDGLVVYATTGGGDGFRGPSSREPLDEGQEVRERQELIYLPTSSAMNANIKVHESSLDKVRPGLPVRITIDALAGKHFSGKVAKIAPLPDAQSSYMNPDLKIYGTEIQIDGDNPELRTGMSCQAEIIVEELKEALFVPVQSVVRIGRQPTVFVMESGKSVKRPIKIGLDNNRLVVVTEGIREGDRVLLSPPLDSATMGPQRYSGAGADADGPSGSSGGAGDAGSSERKKGSGSKSGGDSGGLGGSKDFKSMSPEERKKRFESMSPQEKEKYKSKGKSKGGGSGGGGPPGAG